MNSSLESRPWAAHALIPLIARYVRAKKSLLRTDSLPVSLSLCDGYLASVQRVRAGAARWPALHEIYNWEQPEHRGLWGLIERFWFSMPNCQALRNRYRIVVAAMLEASLGAAVRSDQEPVRILSLASGTSQSTFDALARLQKELPQTQLEVVCVDHDLSALRMAQKLSEDYGVAHCTTTSRMDALRLIATLRKGEAPWDHLFDVVEIVGLVDYLADETIVTLLSATMRLLCKTGGTIITSHIHPNKESSFLREVLDWDPVMRYRTLDEFVTLLTIAGFKEPLVRTEPHGIHTVAVLRSTGS